MKKFEIEASKHYVNCARPTAFTAQELFNIAETSDYDTENETVAEYESRDVAEAAFENIAIRTTHTYAEKNQASQAEPA